MPPTPIGTSRRLIFAASWGQHPLADASSRRVTAAHWKWTRLDARTLRRTLGLVVAWALPGRVASTDALL